VFTAEMFSAQPYEGLPFVGRSRLNRFLSQWDSSSPGRLEACQECDDEDNDSLASDGSREIGLVSEDIHGLLAEFFKVQEETYHKLLRCTNQAATHLDYWLDWATPVVNRPRWIYELGRKTQAAFICMLGRAEQVRNPTKAARHFTHVHAELCRLVAFVKITSFELLSNAEEVELHEAEAFHEVLEQAIESMRCQASACTHVSNSLTPRFFSENSEQLASPNSDSVRRPETTRRPTEGGWIGRKTLSDLWGLPQVGRNQSESQEPAMLSLPEKRRRHGEPVSQEKTVSSSANGSGAASTNLPPSVTIPGQHHSGREDRSGEGESQDHAAGAAVGNGSSIGGNGGLGRLVKTAREQLEECRLSAANLSETLEHVTLLTGCPTHMQRYGPIYTIGGMASLFFGIILMSDRRKREAFFSYIVEVSEQFYKEWVYNPVTQFCTQLFKSLSTDEILNVQLRELKSEQEALDRMVEKFKSVVQVDPTVQDLVQHPQPRDAHHNFEDDIAERYFERSMSNPFYHAMQGHLMESCMVQSQRMKVLMYASMYSVDAIMLQLKWDFLMAGVMPFTVLVGIGYWALTAMYRKRQTAWTRRMVRALAEVDRFLNTHATAITPRRRRSGPLHLGLLERSQSQEWFPFVPGGSQKVRGFARTRSWTDKDPSTHDRSTELEKVGEALGHLDALCRLASHVRLEATDWRAFRRDVLDLTSPELSSQQKLHVVAAMRSTYHVFQVGT